MRNLRPIARTALVWMLPAVTLLSGTAVAGQPPEAAAAVPDRGAAAAVPERRGTEFGYGVFEQHCVVCHGNPAQPRAPSPAALRALPAGRIYAALVSGVMKPVGDGLTDVDKRRVAESLSGQLLGSEQPGDAARMPNRCPRNPKLEDLGGPGWNGWGNGPGNQRFQTAKAAGIDAGSVGRLQLKWAFGFPEGTSAYAQPAIVAGRVFVGSDTGYVYSLDAGTGCVYWSHRTQAGVRTAMTLGTIRVRGRPQAAVFFGDLKTNTYALDAQTGREIWRTPVDDHFAARITAAPALGDGTLYVPVSAWEGFQARVPDFPCCTAVGNVTALDARTGRRLWKTYAIAERPRPVRKNSRGVQLWAPAGAPIWNTPTIDAGRDAVYAGTGDASTYPAPATSDAILALDRKTGKVRWSRQIYPDDSFIVGCSGASATENCPQVLGPDWDIPMSPMLVRLPAGREVLLFGTKPGEVLALDPDRQGEIVWRTKLVSDIPVRKDAPAGSVRGAVWGGAVDEARAYFGLGAGGVAAVSLADGQRAWYAPLNASAAHPVSHASAVTLLAGVVLIGGSDGRLWALSSTDGRVLWSYETARTFPTVNGVAAHGGAIDAPGPVVAGGLLLVGSGYGVVSDAPGNVLLAFGVEERGGDDGALAAKGLRLAWDLHGDNGAWQRLGGLLGS